MMRLIDKAEADAPAGALSEARPEPAPKLLDMAKAQAAAAPYRAVRRRRRRWRLPALFILGPTLLVAIYALVVARPMYVSETRFAIRAAEAAPDVAGGGKGGGVLGSFGAVAAFAADGFALRDFIESPDALAELNAAGDYSRRMARTGIDLLNTLSPDADPGALHRFYARNIDVGFSLTEQIVGLRVFAYSPGDAREIAGSLIGIAERFANKLNERARSDALAQARAEVALAEKRVAAVRAEMNEWRIRNGNIDPTKAIEVAQAVIVGLRKSLVEAQAELQARGALDPRSQRRRELEDRIRGLTAQIDAEQQKLTGAKGSTAQIIGEYERLAVEQEFATRQLTSTEQSLEQARVALARQNKYIAVIVRPTQPTSAAWPSAWRLIGGVLLACALLYAIVTLIGRMVLDSMR